MTYIEWMNLSQYWTGPVIALIIAVAVTNCVRHIANCINEESDRLLKEDRDRYYGKYLDLLKEKLERERKEEEV